MTSIFDMVARVTVDVLPDTNGFKSRSKSLTSCHEAETKKVKAKAKIKTVFEKNIFQMAASVIIQNVSPAEMKTLCMQ